jgi:hypothetical protein
MLTGIYVLYLAYFHPYLSLAFTLFSGIIVLLFLTSMDTLYHRIAKSLNGDSRGGVHTPNEWRRLVRKQQEELRNNPPIPKTEPTTPPPQRDIDDENYEAFQEYLANPQHFAADPDKYKPKKN